MYTSSDHDHRDYAGKHHRHYDLEERLLNVRTDLMSYINGLREDLSALAGRVQDLEARP